MAEWKAKRFWAETRAEAGEGGWQVWLDERQLRTPGKLILAVPTEALAREIAAEWAAQEGEIDPLSMPATRAANSALERVAPQKAEVAQMLAAYGGTDLLCYRAEGPGPLCARQAAGWDPLLDWAAARFGARLAVGAGVTPVAQPPEAVAALGQGLFEACPFELAALHDLITITGSLVLALAVRHGEISAPRAWDLSRIDETWQAEQWGQDEEAAREAGAKREALLFAARLLTLLGVMDAS